MNVYSNYFIISKKKLGLLLCSGFGYLILKIDLDTFKLRLKMTRKLYIIKYNSIKYNLYIHIFEKRLFLDIKNMVKKLRREFSLEDWMNNFPIFKSIVTMGKRWVTIAWYIVEYLKKVISYVILLNINYKYYIFCLV